MEKKTIANLLDNLPEEDKLRLSAKIDQLQIRDSSRVHNSLVEICFKDCVGTFYRKTPNKKEEACVLGCAKKFLELSMLASKKLEDLNSGKATLDD